MTYETQEVTIEGTDDLDIGYALASLAGFPKGSSIHRRKNVYRIGNASECVVAVHKENIDLAGSVIEALGYMGPDIIVSQIKREPQGDVTDWQPTSKYVIEFNHRVDESLVAGIEEEIRTAYAELKI